MAAAKDSSCRIDGPERISPAAHGARPITGGAARKKTGVASHSNRSYEAACKTEESAPKISAQAIAAASPATARTQARSRLPRTRGAYGRIEVTRRTVAKEGPVRPPTVAAMPRSTIIGASPSAATGSARRGSRRRRRRRCRRWPGGERGGGTYQGLVQWADHGEQRSPAPREQVNGVHRNATIRRL